MYTLELTAVVRSPVTDVWDAWADVESYPRWDPREEDLRLDTPFADGATGYSKQHGNPGGPFRIVDLQPGKGWTTPCPLPRGELQIVHSLVPGDDPATTTIIKTYVVKGPLSLVFRLWYGRRIRATQPASFVALADEVATRANR